MLKQKISILRIDFSIFAFVLYSCIYIYTYRNSLHCEHFNSVQNFILIKWFPYFLSKAIIFITVAILKHNIVFSMDQRQTLHYGILASGKIKTNNKEVIFTHEKISLIRQSTSECPKQN